MRLPEAFTESLPLSGIERERFIESLREEPPVSIRLNPIKAKLISKEESVPWCENAFYLSSRPSFTADPAFHAGAYYPQEASSMFIDYIVRELRLNENPINALDLCAAPGGKSTLLRSILHEESFLWANEVVPKRSKILLENLLKWGHENICVSSASSRHLAESNLSFDLILVDAPCSGEGLFRKQPHAIQEWSPNAVNLCAARQEDILSHAWKMIEPGGILIYSTCTYNRKENEENVSRLINNEGAMRVDLKLPFEEIEQVNEFSAFRFWPHRIKGEGLFVSVLQKPESSRSRGRNRNQQKLSFSDCRVGETDQTIQDKNGDVFILNERGRKLLSKVPCHLPMISKGYPIGSFKGKKFVASHGLTMWRNFEAKLVEEINHEEALDFLACRDVRRNSLQSGKVAVQYGGFNLGFGRSESSRLVSRYPKNYRIIKVPEHGYSKVVAFRDSALSPK